MFQKSLLFLSVFITILSFGLLLYYYDQIPAEIAVFIDLEGKPTTYMPKSYLSVFRLPVMGVMLLGICLTMFSVNAPVSNENHKQMWLSAALFGAFKMCLTSMEILLFKELIFLNALRVSILSIILTAIISMVLSLYKLYQNYKGNFSYYSSGVNDWHKTFILTFLSAYLLLVLLPFFA